MTRTVLMIYRNFQTMRMHSCVARCFAQVVVKGTIWIRRTSWNTRVEVMVSKMMMAFLVTTLSRGRTSVTVGTMKQDMDTSKGSTLIVDNELVSWMGVI